MRNVLERASARETVARVAGGSVCKLLLQHAGVTVRARVIRIGGESVAAADLNDPTAIDWEAVEASPTGCHDPQVSEAMCCAIDEAAAAGESLGGVS